MHDTVTLTRPPEPLSHRMGEGRGEEALSRMLHPLSNHTLWKETAHLEP